jgi:hypothetical protein
MWLPQHHKNGHVFATQSTPPQSHNANSHRLPKLALPVFNGNVLNGKPFETRIKSLYMKIPA